MRHPDFVAQLDRPNCGWAVSNIAIALRKGYGPKGSLLFGLAMTAMLLPCIAIAVYVAAGSRYYLLIWPLLAFMGYRTSSTRPTGVGMITCLFIAGAGIVIALRSADWVHVVGGLLPGITWFAACAVKGTAMTFVEEQLRSSAKYFGRLERDGDLILDQPDGCLGHR